MVDALVDSKGTTYNYNNRGLLTSETNGGLMKSHSNDADGNRTRLTVGSLQVSYSYDGAGRLAVRATAT